MSVGELEKMMDVAREGHWEKAKVSALLCAEDKDGSPFLSNSDLKTQTEVAKTTVDPFSKTAKDNQQAKPHLSLGLPNSSFTNFLLPFQFQGF